MEQFVQKISTHDFNTIFNQKSECPGINQFIGDMDALFKKEYAGCTHIEVPLNTLLSCLNPCDRFFPFFQRDIDHARIDQLVEEQEAEFKTCGGYGITSGVIVLGHCDSPLQENKYGFTANEYGLWIVDGQHRLEVLQVLKCIKNADLTGVTISVRIYKAASPEDLKAYYIKINKTMAPHSPYELIEKVTKVIDLVKKGYEDYYNKWFFSTSERAPRPKQSMARLKKELTSASPNSKLIQMIEHCTDTEACAMEILDKFKRYNDTLSLVSYIKFGSNNSAAEQKRVFEMREECATHRPSLYLGLIPDFTWIDQALGFAPIPEKFIPEQRPIRVCVIKRKQL
jgi:hypothetical protein